MISDGRYDEEVDCDYVFDVILQEGAPGWGGWLARTDHVALNRQDYGVSWSKSLDTDGLVVADDVEIAIEIEAIKAK
jgi:polyisoprenoid-binding protein YceI